MPTGPRSVGQLALPPGHRLRLRDHPLRSRQRLVERVDPAQEPAELEAAEDLLQLRAVGRAGDEVARVDAELEVAAHRREQLRRARLLLVLGDRSRARRGEVARVLEHRLERAVLGDELARGLVPDAGDARDVVARVPLEADEVRHLIRAHAVAGLHALRRVDVHVRDAARRHHQRDVLGDELERVAVRRDDAGLDPRLVRLRRERRDHVVRLPALELEVHVPERLHDRPEVRELLAQQVGHRRAAPTCTRREISARCTGRVSQATATPRGR